MFNRAQESGRSLLEQSEHEQQEMFDNGTTTIINCFGAICLLAQDDVI